MTEKRLGVDNSLTNKSKWLEYIFEDTLMKTETNIRLLFYWFSKKMKGSITLFSLELHTHISG